MGRHYDYRRLQGRHFRQRRKRTVIEQVRALIGSYYRLLVQRIPRR